MEELLKRLGIDVTADAEEIVRKLELKQSEIMERLDNVEDEKRKQRLEDDLAQIKAAITAFSWMKGKEQTGIAREEDAVSEDFSDLKGQAAEERRETVQAERKEEKTEEALYDEALAVMATPDYAKGVEMMRHLAESGYAPAQHQMGELYREGNRVQKDERIAVEWFRKAADQGNANAQFKLGVMYYKGEGVAEDKLEAAICFRKAAEQGEAPAQTRLGSMYFRGEGVAEDKLEGAMWLRKAADQGVGVAQAYLGYMYEFGDGAAKDRAKAVEWYRKAARQGVPTAQESLEKLGESY